MNYFSWKPQVTTHLRGNGLLGFIESKVTTDNALDYQQDQLLLRWIFSTITPSVLSQVTTYDTSFKVWSALISIFNQKSKMRILQVKNKMNNFKKERRSVESYLMEITQLAREVREAGVPLDDSELSLVTLNGLDSSYDAFVTSLTARADDLTSMAFSGLLQAHKKKYSHPPSSTVVSMANAHSNHNFGVITCQICLKRGHSTIACFKRHNEGWFPIVVDRYTN